ncbi:MAG: hypothetical protein WBS18_10175 [Candidatus Acidiferrales bacterium]
MGNSGRRPQDAAQLWLAAASAAGLDLGRDFIGKQAAERVVPAIVDRVAVKFDTEVAEKWAARIVPLVSAGAGGSRRGQRRFRGCRGPWRKD